MRLAYVNGAYVPHQHATVAMEDRGYQFADGCYEVCMFYNQRFLDWDLHLERLHYSLDTLRISAPMSDAALRLVLDELILRNPYRDGFVYIQVTRGVAKRNHLFPVAAKPSLTISVMPAKAMSETFYTHGAHVIAVRDERWARCDVKSISLLPNVLARQRAADAGAYEVFMFNDNDKLTEGALSTAFIVQEGAVHTHPVNETVLNGVRKQVVKRLCAEHGIGYHERMISRDEVFSADEAFMTSANAHILPITTIDDCVIGQGMPGPVTLMLLDVYRQHVTKQTGKLWH